MSDQSLRSLQSLRDRSFIDPKATVGSLPSSQGSGSSRGKRRRKKNAEPPSQNIDSILPAQNFELPGVLFRPGVEVPEPPPNRKIFFRSAKVDAEQYDLGGFPILESATVGHDDKEEATRTVVTKAHHEQNERAFSDIVDEDTEEAFDNYLSDELLGGLLESWGFRLFILGIIITNAVLVGLQTDPYVEKVAGSFLNACDNVFLTIFVVEIILKWYNGFFAFWKSGWNVFDFLIVAVAFLGQGISYFSSGRVLRVLRVIRAFRALRSITALDGLQLIVQTVLRSLPDMLNIMLLLAIFMFIFAVVGMNFFGEDAPNHFGDLAKSLYTLFILLTQDGWVDIYRELEALKMAEFGAIYCVFFILIGAFVFVNLIVGVTVNNLQEAFKEMQHTKQQKSRALRKRQDPVDRRSNNVTSVDISRVQIETWARQHPTEIPDFSKISTQRLENYFLMLSAIEDNLQEFSRLKSQINHIVLELQETNQQQAEDDNADQQPEMPEETLEEPIGPVLSGDVISRAIRAASQKQEAERRNMMQRERAQMLMRRQQMDHMQEKQRRSDRARAWALGDLLKERQKIHASPKPASRGLKSILKGIDSG